MKHKTGCGFYSPLSVLLIIVACSSFGTTTNTSSETNLPVVNLRDFLGPDATPESQLRVAREWDLALREFGFAAIIGHGIPSSAFSGLYAAAKDFFALPMEEKMKSCPGGGYGSSGGFTPGGIESVSRTLSIDEDKVSHNEIDAPPDLVESLVFLRDWADVNISDHGQREQQHVLPSEPPELVPVARDYQRFMARLVGTLHELSAAALGLVDEDAPHMGKVTSNHSQNGDCRREFNYFEQFYSPNPSFALRLAYYPPLEYCTPQEQTHKETGQLPRRKLSERLLQLWRNLRGKQRKKDRVYGIGDQGTRAVRYGAHTDYQGFTILRQDPSQQGLEILFPDGVWRAVHSTGSAVHRPEEGVVSEEVLLVNIGDLFQQWTNDRWKSTMHRVSNPPQGSDGARSDRLSLVFFTGPRDDALIEVLPCCTDGPGAGYEPVLAGAHLKAKLQVSNV